MRTVLHVVTSLNFGGVESHVGLVLERDHQSAFSHSVCALGHGGYVEESLRELGAQVFVLRQKPRIPSLGAIVSLVKLLRSLKPDVVHTHGAEANFHGVIAARLCGQRIVLAEEIGIPTHSWLARINFRAVYSLASKVISVSEVVAEELMQLREATSDQISVLPNPVRIEDWAVYEPDAGTFRLGFVGRLEEKKNPLELVRAVNLLVRRGANLSLDLVGDGSLWSSIESEIQLLELSDCVRLHGYSPSPVSDLLNCHLIVQPSLSEGFGLAVAEAMAAGIPVLSTSLGHGFELIEDGVSGWHLASSDKHSVATAIERIMGIDYSERLQVGERGKEFVRANFSVNQYLKKLDGMYLHLIQSAGAS